MNKGYRNVGVKNICRYYAMPGFTLLIGSIIFIVLEENPTFLDRVITLFATVIGTTLLYTWTIWTKGEEPKRTKGGKNGR